jgi:glycosyltransferase involved in cell wall biosynthesis
MSKILFIGPRPTNDPKQNPGGQLSSANGLVRYMEKASYQIEAVNTIQPSFPPPSQNEKVLVSLLRVIEVFKLLVRSNDFQGCIMYCGGLSSFIERFVLCALCRLRNVPVVLLIRNSALLKIKDGTSIASFFKLGLRLPYKVILQGEKWSTHLISLGVSKDRLEVIPSWLSDEWEIGSVAKKVETGQTIRFIFIGWLVKDKGIVEILEACRALRDEGYQFNFTLVGGGTFLDSTAAFISKYHLNDIVTIAGWQGKEEIRSLLSSSHVFVLPTYHEGFPNALMEAMSVGLPAISTDVGAITETLIDEVNGYVIKVGDAKDLTNAMKKYINNTSLVGHHSVRALEIVAQRHSASRNCKRILDLVSSPKL